MIRQSPHRTLLRRFGVCVALGMASLAAIAAANPGAAAKPPSDYQANLQLIRDQTVRNRIYDQSAYRDVPQAQLVPENHYGPRSDYLARQGSRRALSFPTLQGGQFRAECEFSHFGYDDPILNPGQPGAAHLHVFWGNTDVNAYSTYDTLSNSGSSTCAGQELNRTGYWAPAVFDAAGNVRIPEVIFVYYKGYGLARENAEAYPPGAAMVQKENLNEVSWNEGGLLDPTGAEPASEFAFNCSDQDRGPRSPAATSSIPICDGNVYRNDNAGYEHATLEMHVKFGNCWNREDPSNPTNWTRARQGGWFYSDCAPWATFPNIEYIIAYPLARGETTDGWYLSSDVDPMTLQRNVVGGSTVHADWWGGWHPETNRTWLENCTRYSTNVPSDCGFGYLTDGGPDGENPLPGPALQRTRDFEGPISVSSEQLLRELCPSRQTGERGPAAAYCAPAGHVHPPATTTVTTVPVTTVPVTTVPVTTVPVTTVPVTTVPVTTVPVTTVPVTTVPSDDPASCVGQKATVIGSDGDDVLVGTPGPDVIAGGPGSDIIVGRAGDDVICGGSGVDTLIGNEGVDYLFGDDGDDRITGGSGDDVLEGGAGNDRLFGGGGSDLVRGGGGDDFCDKDRRRDYPGSPFECE
jgi:hypothetical protein